MPWTLPVPRRDEARGPFLPMRVPMTQLQAERFRLVTRSDFDGLVCAALLKHLDMLDDVKFVHPKDVQDGKVELGAGDITTNLPYHPGVHIAFDHHHSETIRVEGHPANHVIVPGAESAARVVYEHFGAADTFPGIDELMEAVDKADAAQFTLGEILHPTGWVLLNFLMDPRTGLGRFRDFRISNYQLMMQLIDVCTTTSVDEILETPDVAERVDLTSSTPSAPSSRSSAARPCTATSWCSTSATRRSSTRRTASRSTRCSRSATSRSTCSGASSSRTPCSRPASRSSTAAARPNVGELMLSYGGGGHEAAGTCQVENDDAARVLGELVGRITSDG